MNKKITIQNSEGEAAYCILAGERDLEDQFNEWYYGSANPAHGVCVRFDGKSVSVVDYYHDERMASFDVIGVEDTPDAPILDWIAVGKKGTERE